MSRLQGIPQLPFHPRPQRSTGKLASASPGPPAPEPLDPRALDPGAPWGTLPRDPRTSPQGWLSPETSCTAAGSESHPQVIPPLSGDGGGGDGGGCDPNGPLHAPGRAAGGRGASHAGRGRWGGARSPSRTEPREPGTRAPGGELGGGVPGRAPAAALLPAERADARHQSRGRRAPAETEAGRRGRGSPARAPPRGARAACQISGGQGCTTAPRGDSRSAGAYAPPVCPLHTDTPAGKCGRSLQFCRPGEGELPERDTEAPVRSALTLPSPSLAPERRHSWPVHPLHVPGFPPMPRPGRLPFEKPPCVALVLI